MSKKLSRRDFARKSVAAGAAAAALPSVLLAKSPAAGKPSGSVKAAGASVAKRRRLVLPPEVAYGGQGYDGQNVTLDSTLRSAGQMTGGYADGWSEGTTIPVKYYTDDAIYANDEEHLRENFWFMVDHHDRIRNPGDYFVFEYGRGDSVIVLRDKAGEVKAFHNVCRHRGSRVCQHGFDGVRPSEARPDGKPVDPVLSIVQLGPEGNTPVFRCPYHAWTYDLEGKLVSYPQGMASDFDASQNGLHPAHVRTVGGFIWISLASGEAPEFDPWINMWKSVTEKYQTADLKIASRLAAPTKANWKFVIENFRECYHCYASHSRSYSAVHQIYGDPDKATGEIRDRISAQMAGHGHPRQPFRNPRDRANYRPQDNPIEGLVEGFVPVSDLRGSHLTLGFLTGTLDGKPASRLLPGRTEWTHTGQRAATGFSSSWMMAYDDHVVVVRFTPRDTLMTDAEVFWLVHPDAEEGKDYDVAHMQALWGNTYREDRWLSENQQYGVGSTRFNFEGKPQPYAASEGGPAGFIEWYMREMIGGRSGQTDAA